MQTLATILVIVTILGPGAERTQMMQVENLAVCEALAARHNQHSDVRAYCQQLDVRVWRAIRNR